MMGMTAMIDPDRRLAAALLLRAVKDAQSDDPVLASEARRWLAGRGTFWAELALNISRERLMCWVDRLSTLPYEQLTLFDGLTRAE
ncbi:MAG: hypothetical protein GY832_35470 [Chloroflexi bacterium]|nr:hypothetical protein [Chloroflexota bacterium]